MKLLLTRNLLSSDSSTDEILAKVSWIGMSDISLRADHITQTERHGKLKIHPLISTISHVTKSNYYCSLSVLILITLILQYELKSKQIMLWL